MRAAVITANYEDRIRGSEGSLSPSFGRLADYLLDSYVQAAFMTATELAHRLDIDPGTVVRFAQHLGYGGFPELQREIRQRVKRELLAESLSEPGTEACVADQALSDVLQSLERTRKSFPHEDAQRIITALDTSTRVILLAAGPALPAARTLAQWLEAAGYTIHLSGSSPEELAQAVVGAHKGDLILAIEVSTETPYLARALAEAQRAGLDTAAIVAAPSSLVTRHADIVLASRAETVPGIGQILLESMVFALARMLEHARPGRYEDIADSVSRLTQRLTGEATQ